MVLTSRFGSTGSRARRRRIDLHRRASHVNQPAVSWKPGDAPKAAGGYFVRIGSSGAGFHPGNQMDAFAHLGRHFLASPDPEWLASLAFTQGPSQGDVRFRPRDGLGAHHRERPVPLGWKFMAIFSRLQPK